MIACRKRRDFGSLFTLQSAVSPLLTHAYSSRQPTTFRLTLYQESEPVISGYERQYCLWYFVIVSKAGLGFPWRLIRPECGKRLAS